MCETLITVWTPKFTSEDSLINFVLFEMVTHLNILIDSDLLILIYLTYSYIIWSTLIHSDLLILLYWYWSTHLFLYNLIYCDLLWYAHIDLFLQILIYSDRLWSTHILWSTLINFVSFEMVTYLNILIYSDILILIYSYVILYNPIYCVPL